MKPKLNPIINAQVQLDTILLSFVLISFLAKSYSNSVKLGLPFNYYDQLGAGLIFVVAVLISLLPFLWSLGHLHKKHVTKTSKWILIPLPGAVVLPGIALISGLIIGSGLLIRCAITFLVIDLVFFIANEILFLAILKKRRS
jgi:hypothetical protein